MIVDQEHLNQLAQFFDRSEDKLTLHVSQEDGVVTLEYHAEGRERPVGLFEFTLIEGVVEYDIMNFYPEYRSAGFYRKAVKLLPAWMRDLGVMTWRVPVLAEENGEFHRDLVDTGWQDVGSLVFEVDLSEGSRVDEYNAWVYDDAEEPEWHAALSEDFRVTTGPQS